MAAAAVAAAEQVVADLREKCAAPASLLRDLASAMADEMGAGLEKEGGSRVKMLLSYVDKLPTGLVHTQFSRLVALSDQRKLWSLNSCFLVV